MKKPFTSLPHYMALTCAGIIVLLPFHAFLTVWASSLVGHYTILRLWKEALLLALAVGALYILVTRAKERTWVRREPLVILTLAYLLCLLVSGLLAYALGHVSLKAFLFGLLLDGRFLVFFLITWLVTRYDDLIVRYWRQLVVLPAVVVVCFAVMERVVLPADFLRHFGYGTRTIPAISTVDQQASYQRVQATLRGPNPLGAYLLVVLSALGGLLLKARYKAKGKRLGLAVLYVLSVVALVFTFSRSAWLGLVAGTLSLVWSAITSPKGRRLLVICVMAVLVGFGGTAYGLRHNDRFENVFFHTSEHSRSALSSNAGHSTALKEGIRDVVHEPLGRGTGTAGPASVYNLHPARIAENYYVQLGQEGGLAVLALFIAINVMVTVRLWRRSQDILGMTLLASFIGITVVNMLMHGWADDTLSYIWWGMAGAAMTLPTNASERHEATH